MTYERTGDCGDQCFSVSGVHHPAPHWSEMQVDLSELSSRSRHLVARQGGRYIHKDEPERVIEVVNWVYSTWQADVRGMVKVQVGVDGH